MGMFSWNCKGCHHSIREGAEWMGEAVALTKKGSRIFGSYDGYGRIDGTDLVDLDGKVELWHEACWTLQGKPEFTGPSKSARDQGMPNCDRKKPKSQEDVLALRAAADAVEAEERAYAKRYTEYDKAKHEIIGGDCPYCKFNTAFVVTLPNCKVAVRCPNRQCNNLRPLTPRQQDSFRELWKVYPDMHEPRNDDEVNVDAKKQVVHA